MARRLTGDLIVAKRPNGGVLVTIRSATGEAFEIECSPEQVGVLREQLGGLGGQSAKAKAGSKLLKPFRKST